MEGLANAPLRCCGCLARLTLVPARQVSRSFCLGQGQEGHVQGRGARGPPPRAVLEAGLCVLPAGSSTQPLHSLASQGAPRPPPTPPEAQTSAV